MAVVVGASRFRRAGLGLVVFVAAGCAAPAASSVSPEPTEGATVVPSPTSQPTTGDAPIWQEVGSFGAANTMERVTAMAYGAGQFVAVGNHYATAYAPDDELPLSDGRIWLSPDGRSWEPLRSQANLERAALTNLIAAQDGSLLAFGNSLSESGGGEPAVWRSLDGQTWDRFDVGLPSDLPIRSVVHGAQGYLLMSFEQIWFSPDGLAWERVDEDRPFRGIGAGDEGFVALFEAASGDAAVTLASADGRAWFSGDALPGGAAVAPLGPDWTAAVVPGVVEFPVDLEIWSSANGLAWTQVAMIHDPQDRDSFGYVQGLVSAGVRVVLTVALAVGGGVALPAGVWSSEDGIVWELADTDPDSLVTTAAEHDGTVAFAGYVGVTEGRATFWITGGP